MCDEDVDLGLDSRLVTRRSTPILGLDSIFANVLEKLDSHFATLVRSMGFPVAACFAARPALHVTFFTAALIFKPAHLSCAKPSVGVNSINSEAARSIRCDGK
jgi:hypothetical protein